MKLGEWEEIQSWRDFTSHVHEYGTIVRHMLFVRSMLLVSCQLLWVVFLLIYVISTAA